MRNHICRSALAVALLTALTPIACGGSTTQPAEPTPTAPATTGTDPSGTTDTEPPVKEPTIAATFAAECRQGLLRAKSLLPALVATEGPRTEANLLVPTNELLFHLSNSAGTASLMSEVHPDASIREAASKCREDVAKFGTELEQNQKLFAAFQSIDTKALDADAKRFVDHTLRDFRRAGVDKDEKTRQRLQVIDAELTTLSNDFQKNIRTDVKKIKVKPEELAGLPQDWIDSHKPGKDGMVTITTDYTDYIPYTRYADSTERRRELYLVYRSRGGEANLAVLGNVLKLREEKAKILGYAHWADYNLEDKMVRNAKTADKFIARVIKSSKRKAKKDYAELLAYKRKHLDRKAKLVEDYEKTYIANKLKATKYKFDSQAIRPFLAYNQVKAGLLDITGTIYGVRYEKAADAKVWHQDVEAYDVFRVGDGEKLGRIFLDMHPRDGKYKHAAQFDYRTGAKGLALPQGVLVCNFPNPRTDGDALMEHGDVETMFHEFGHLMHHTLGGHQKWIRHAGTNTERDFVEAPSQMFEEWANSHETLARFAKHHKSGEVIGKDLVKAMRKARAFGTGTDALQQMYYASISLGFHTADPAKLNMTEKVKQLQNTITPFRYLDGNLFHASFGHLMGYSAHYYTYMWSRVIAEDLLSPFKRRGLMDPALNASYRDKILVPGGTKDAADLVKNFLGRKFNYRAFENFLAGR